MKAVAEAVDARIVPVVMDASLEVEVAYLKAAVAAAVEHWNEHGDEHGDGGEHGGERGEEVGEVENSGANSVETSRRPHHSTPKMNRTHLWRQP